MYPTGDDYGLYLAKKVQSYYSKKSNVTLNIVDDSTNETQKEILIGNTNRYTTSLTEQEYAVTLKNSKLIFEAGHQATLEKAVTLFISRNFIPNTVNELKGVADDFESTRTIDGKTYSYVWGDEFDATALNLDKFTYGYHGFGNGYENGTYTSIRADKEEYTPDNARIANGTLTLRATMDEEGNVKNGEGLCTAHTMWYKYGYAEMRAKIALKQGAWPSWWATDACGDVNEYPNDLADFNITNRKYLVEVDMFESFGDDLIQANIHKWYESPYTKKFTSANIANSFYTPTKILTGETVTHTENMSKATAVAEREEYHTFGFLWTENKLQMFIDGVSYASYNLKNSLLVDSYTNNDGFRNPMHFIFENGLFLDGCRGERQDGTNATYSDFPIEYSIDYVRLYQTSEDTLYNFGLEKSLNN